MRNSMRLALAKAIAPVSWGFSFNACALCANQEKPIQRPQAATVNHTPIDANATMRSDQGLR